MMGEGVGWDGDRVAGGGHVCVRACVRASARAHACVCANLATVVVAVGEDQQMPVLRMQALFAAYRLCLQCSRCDQAAQVGQRNRPRA